MARSMLFATVSAAACAAASPAHAQEVVAEANDDQNSGIQEIVVTAQKRAENVQDIPIAVTALGAEALQSAGFDELADLTRLAPSLQISNFGPIAFVTMRGIGNENSTAGGDPGVALHFDGIYIGRPVGSLFTAFDTARVEVLRGPQGTLYGRNATGGSINYITTRPQSDFSASGDLTYGSFDRKRARGVVNLPVGDGLSTRVVGFIERRDGFSENAFPGRRDANDADNWGVRGHILFEPTGSNFSALLSATYIKSGGVGSQAELREPFPGTTTGQNLAGPPIPGTNNYLVNGVPVLNDLRPFRENENADQFQNNRFLLFSATLENDFGPVTLKSITGYVETGFNSRSDHDFSPLPLAELLLTEDSKQFSQEIQLLSNNDSAFKWIVGGFYFHEEASRRSQFFGSRYDIIARGAGVVSGFDVGGDITSRSYAAFAQATYDISERFSLTGGLRYTNDRKRGTNSGFQFGPAPYSGPVAASFDAFTYRLAADFDVTDDILVYASYSTGYKSGGVNQVSIPALTNPVYRPETVKAIELGLKSRLLERRLQMNLALYHNKYDDLQFQVFGVSGPEAFNADGATVQGVELEIVALPADSLRFDASAAYTDATFDTQVVQGVQLGGNLVQRTPEWTFNAGVTADWEVGFGSMRLRAEVNHTSAIHYSAFNRRAGFAAPGGSDYAQGYDNANLRLFWFSPNERFSLELYATNVFDTVQTGNVFRDIGFLDIPGGGGPENVSYLPPRQFGATFAFKF